MRTLSSKVLLLATLLMLWSGVADADLARKLRCQPFGGVSELVCPVSMIQLISAPEEYSGKTIAVIGYIAASGPNAFLFYDQRSYLVSDLNNAVRLTFPTKEGMTENLRNFVGGYYRVVGKFEAYTERLPQPSNALVTSPGRITVEKDFVVMGIPWGILPE